MTQYPIAPDNAIIVGGLPLYMEFEQGALTGDALILPGDLVEFTNPSADCSVKAAQADSTTVIGVAKISPVGAVATPRGGTRTEAYQESDPISIVRGPLTVMLRIEASQDIQCGEMVQPAASGQVKAYICGTDNSCQRIAQALETTAVDTTAFSWAVFALERFG